jgi:hypothetical protein
VKPARSFGALLLLCLVSCAKQKSVSTDDLGARDLSVAAPNDLTGVTLDLATSPSTDLTGLPPADLTGLPLPDLLTAASPDLMGYVLPSSDSFSGSSLDGAWTIFRPSVVTVAVSSGQLHMTVSGGSLWYNTNQGPAVYKNVTGNFKVTSTVHAHRVGMADNVPPIIDVHLAGLMARRDVAEGMGSQEDYVFLVVGYDVNDLSVEHKTTTDGVSTYDGPTWAGGGEAELRICRVGSTFRLYKRALGASTWTLATTYERPDLPSTLQVGAVTYSSQASPDLTGSFDSLDFAPASGESDCTN